jgi:hypothetical protein
MFRIRDLKVVIIINSARRNKIVKEKKELGNTLHTNIIGNINEFTDI